MQDDLKRLVDIQINKDRIEKDGVLNWDSIHEIKAAFYSGKTENYIKLWYILMFQMWYEKWM